jgi:hypothetical protein
MRKVVLYELLSLDGVAEDPDTFFTDWDEAIDANLAAITCSPTIASRGDSARLRHACQVFQAAYCGRPVGR